MRASIRSRPSRRTALPPEPRLQTNPRQDLQRSARAGGRDSRHYGWVDKNAGVVRIPIERSDEADARARACPRGQETQMTRDELDHRGHEGHRGSLVFLDSVLCPSCPLCGALSCAAQRIGPDDRRPAAGLQTRARHARVDRCRRRCARSASTRTSIGRVPLDTPFRRRGGPRPSGSATTSASGRSSWCSRTTTARCCARRCSTGSRARSACCRSTPGKDFEVVTVSFDPRETPATAAAKKATYLRALQAARRRRRAGTS